ncbi:MAG: protein kinase [Bryobacterales bacterium]|nr:protein kinase [Bryobacterales bacterium]
MTPEQWREIRSHLDACLEIKGSERQAYLARLLPDVREEVEAMLDADSATAAFLDEPLVQLKPSAPPQRIGHYAIQREIGRGGMGTVYHAIRDDEAYQAEVAIKVLQVGLDSDFFARRLRFERQLLAYLNHPSIVRLLDGGATPDGRPYLATEYVEGQPLLNWCRERKLGLAERLRLFLPVCDAVHYAHQNLIIHCDLKPGNVMVNQQGTPKLLDFGIARLLVSAPVQGDITAAGMRLLTLPYASPEQIRGERVTTATDVYSLGATLFELVTGSAPFGSARPLTSLEADPPRGSDRITSESPVAAEELRGDVDNILCKAMDPQPARRYESAEQLAADLRRHLEHEPVMARPLTRRYRLQKFAQRNRPLVWGLAAAAAALAIGATVSALGWREAARERDQARRLYDNAHQLARAFVFDLDDTLRKFGPTGARKLIVEKGLASLDRLAADPLAGPTVRREMVDAYIKLGDVLGREGSANVGQTAEAQRSYEKARQLGQQLLRDHPRDAALTRTMGVVNTRISGVLKAQGRFQESLEHGSEAIRILEARVQSPDRVRDDRRELAIAYLDVGNTLSQLGQFDKAVEVRRRLVAMAEELTKRPGATADDRAAAVLARIRLASILTQQKQHAEAQQLLERAIADAKPFPRSDLWSSALFSSGINFRAQQRWTEALASFRESHTLREARATKDPADLRIRSLAATSLSRVGEAEAAVGQWQAGLAHLSEALEQRLKLAQRDTANTGAQAELGESHWLLGNAWRTRNGAKARDHWEKGRAILAPLAARRELGPTSLDQLAEMDRELGTR